MRLDRLIGVGALSLLIAGGANALDLLPEIVQLAGPHRARLQAPLTLINDSPDSVEVRLEIGSIEGQEESWIRVSPQKIRLKPGERKSALIKVRVPREGQGERAAQVRASARGVGALVEYRLVRKVNLRVAGTERYEVILDAVSSETNADRVLVTADVANAGNVTVIPVCEANLVLDDGRRVTAYQERGVGAVAPGRRVRVRVAVPLAGGRWAGAGVVAAHYKDAGGIIHRIEKTVGD